MSEQINLEEILKSRLPSTSIESDNWLNLLENPVVKNWVIRAMKEACKQTLELAAENAEAHGSSCGFGSYWVDKQSILDTIKQVK